MTSMWRASVCSGSPDPAVSHLMVHSDDKVSSPFLNSFGQGQRTVWGSMARCKLVALAQKRSVDSSHFLSHGRGL